MADFCRLCLSPILETTLPPVRRDAPFHERCLEILRNAEEKEAAALRASDRGEK